MVSLFKNHISEIFLGLNVVQELRSGRPGYIYMLLESPFNLY